MRISIACVICAITSVIGLARHTYAGEEPSSQGLHHEFEGSFKYAPASKAKDMPGEIGIIESGDEYSYEFKVFGKLPIKLSVGSEYIGIDDEGVEVELPAHLTGVTTDFETTFPLFGVPDTYFRIGVSPSMFSENWNFETSAFRVHQRYLVIYKPSDQLILVGGVIVNPDSESDVSPAIGCIYRPNDKLEFYLIPPEPRISYDITKSITLFLTGGGGLSEYEVDKGELKNVVLRYKEVHAGTGVTFKLNKFIETTFVTGGEFNRNLKYLDSLGKVNIEDGFYSQVRVDIKL